MPNGGVVKRKRRVELHIEHREISVFATPGQSVGTPYGQPVDFPRSDGTGLLQVRHAACPSCGSADLVLLSDAVAHARVDLAALNQGMQDGSVHFHRSPSGEWWICTHSMHQS
jgi:hypothetical protein